MTQAEINQCSQNAKANCSSFVDCVWDESNKCIVYSFRNAVDAGSFKAQREIQGSLSHMEIQICHSNLTAMREYRA